MRTHRPGLAGLDAAGQEQEPERDQPEEPAQALGRAAVVPRLGVPGVEGQQDDRQDGRHPGHRRHRSPPSRRTAASRRQHSRTRPTSEKRKIGVSDQNAVVAERHVEEVDAVGFAGDPTPRGLLGVEPGKVERIELQRRLPEAPLVEVRLGAELRVDQLELAEGRVLRRQGRRERDQEPRGRARAASSSGTGTAGAPRPARRRTAPGISLTAVNAAKKPTAGEPPARQLRPRPRSAGTGRARRRR